MVEVVGTALSAVQTFLEVLQRPELNNIRSMVEYKFQLDDLQGTVETLESVLRDVAEVEQELLSDQEKVQINELKELSMKPMIDLFDEFVTLVQQDQLLKADGRVSEKVQSFFSLSSNPLSVAYRMSRGVKKINKKLDAIAHNKQFSFIKHYSQPFKHDPRPVRNRRPVSCSYVNEVEIIGRKDELEEIVRMLLDTSDIQRDNVSFLSIVGIGGLGETALAQLVFNNPSVTSAFSRRKWTCVADQDQNELDVKEVLCMILSQNHEGSCMEHVHTTIRKKLTSQRYLLVLDDVWTENRNQWCGLVKYLVGGQRGSWIVVTTRSQKTASIVDGAVHELQGLSEKNSWHLFQQTSFTSDQSSNPPEELVKVGQKIVDRYAKVPLAIKMPGWLTLVQNILTLELYNCGELEYVKFYRLAKLEYIGVDDLSWADSSSTMPMSGLGSCDKELSFFPSLKQVLLEYLPKLKGWKRGVVGRVENNNSGNKLQSQQLLPCLSQLQTLNIYDCPELTCLPSCPGLEILFLQEFNQGLQIINKKRDEIASTSSSASTSCYDIVNSKLQRVNVDNIALPSEYFHCVNTLTVSKVKEELDMPNWMQFLPALQTLEIFECGALKAIPKWMPKLTSLTTLNLRDCSEGLKRRCRKNPPGDNWSYIQHIPNIQFLVRRLRLLFRMKHYSMCGWKSNFKGLVVSGEPDLQMVLVFKKFCISWCKCTQADIIRCSVVDLRQDSTEKGNPLWPSLCVVNHEETNYQSINFGFHFFIQRLLFFLGSCSIGTGK